MLLPTKKLYSLYKLLLLNGTCAPLMMGLASVGDGESGVHYLP